MNQFVLQHGRSAELLLFQHIQEVGIKKNGSIQLKAFPTTTAAGLRLYYIIEGRFEWCINHQPTIFYPGDVALILPGVPFGSDNGVLEIGTYTWIQLSIQNEENGHIQPGKWSGLSESEGAAISKILLLNPSPVISKFPEVGKMLKCIHAELFSNEVGYQACINRQIDELMIQVARKMTKQSH